MCDKVCIDSLGWVIEQDSIVEFPRELHSSQDNAKMCFAASL